MKRLLFITPLVVCTLAAVQIQAQAPNEDIGRYSEKYVHTAGDNTALFVGRIQEQMPGNIESLYLREKGYEERDSAGTHIFPQPVPPLESYALGDILYDGVFYVGVRMRLDLYRDEFMVASPGSTIYSAILSPERLDYADLRGYRIINSPSDDLPGVYYQQLHDGRHEVLRKERFEFSRSKMEFTAHFIRYYIKKEGEYHSVGRRQSAVLKLFRDHRSELRKFIRDHRLNMRRNPEEALVEIAKEYERLTSE